MKKPGRFNQMLANFRRIATILIVAGTLLAGPGCSNKSEQAAIIGLKDMAVRERQVSLELQREIRAHQERTAMDRVVIVVMAGGIAITCFKLLAR